MEIDLRTADILGVLDNSQELDEKDKQKIKQIIKDAYWKRIKKLCKERLEQVLKYLEKNDYKAISEMLDYSPAGDGYGCDNSIISIGEDINGKHLKNSVGDIIGVADLLSSLCMHCGGKQ